MTTIKTEWDPKQGLRVEVERQQKANNRLRSNIYEQEHWLRRRSKHDKLLTIITLVILATILIASMVFK